MSVKQLLAYSKAIEFDPNAMSMLNRPGVYMYVFKDKAQYIGSARKVGQRAFCKGHHKRNQLPKGISLIIFPCASYENALVLEQQLIDDLRPALNGTNPVAIGRMARLLGITKNSARTIRQRLTLCPAIPSE